MAKRKLPTRRRIPPAVPTPKIQYSYLFDQNDVIEEITTAEAVAQRKAQVRAKKLEAPIYVQVPGYSVPPSSRMTLLNMEEDFIWLQEGHLPNLPANAEAVILHGSEDSPDRFDVYTVANPDINDVPIIFEPASEQIDVEDFIDGYKEAALWASTDEEGIPLDRDHDVDDISEDTAQEMAEDCKSFIENHGNLIYAARINASQAGHDFWLTREHHGTGYWDRGLGAIGDELTKAAHAYGEFYIYVGDDGKIHS